MKDETVYEAPINTSTSLVRRISWAAIFAGLVVAIVIEMVLSVLGISIGATVVNPMSDSTTARNLGIGEAIWFLVVSIISLFIGGWVAGRSSGLARGGEGALHGLVTWSAATLVTVFLVASGLGALLSGASGIVQGLLPAASQSMNTSTGQGAVGEALQEMSGGAAGSMPQEAQSLAQGNPQLTASIGRLLAEAPNVRPEDRQAVVNALTSDKHMSQDQANQTVDRWIQNAQQTKSQMGQKAQQAGETATRGISAAGWASFIVLVLSGIAAAWGGSSGAAAFLRSRPAVEVRVTT